MFCVDLNKRLRPSNKLLDSVTSIQAEIVVQGANLRDSFKNTITLIAYMWQSFSISFSSVIYLPLPECIIII